MGHVSLRVRLDVTDVQAGVLLRAAGARRFAWNWAIARIKENADQWAAEATYGVDKVDRVRPFDYFSLGRLWTAAHPIVAPWSAEHSTWTFRYALQAATKAHSNFLAGKCRFPRFKSRHRDRPRFTLRDGVTLEAGRVRLSKYGWIRIASACPAQARLRRRLRRGRARLLYATVVRSADGHWYASLTYGSPTGDPAWPVHALPGRVVGVDRGVKTAAVVATSTGQVVAQLCAIRALRDRLRHVKHLQRGICRAKTHSANRRKAVARLGRVHARGARLRADAVHTFTAALARAHSVVVAENLATSNLMANHHLASAIGDQGWSELSRQLAYKTARYGGMLLIADCWFASSKTCSACGAVKSKVTLAERTYRCDVCGLISDRDANAAANLAAWGEHTLGICPCVIQAGDRHPGGPTAEVPRHACGGWVSAAAVIATAVPSGEAGTSQPQVVVA